MVPVLGRLWDERVAAARGTPLEGKPTVIDWENTSICMSEDENPPPSEGTPPPTRKHDRSPEQVSPRTDRRARKRTALQAESEGEDFTTQMADVSDSSPAKNPYDLATGATSQVDEPVPPLAFKPIRSKKQGMRGKPGSSKAGPSNPPTRRPET
ncbi:hypothetical protein EYR36_010697 [Pleurotus pulmonarius]|nr:hypothetical protein EYR36_010697 [Pleurotus pulmonarius]